MPTRVVALFKLASDVSVEEYSAWSLERVRPVMRRMESVLRFDDFRVVGTMDGGESEYDFCEIIEITDVERFERDNETGEGADLAREWQARLTTWNVMYLEDFGS